MRSIKVLSLILCVVCICGISSSCTTFEDYCKTTDDGFTYYFHEYTKEGVYIINIPDVEDLVIPEYINGERVKKLGHYEDGLGYGDEYFVEGINTKKLTIQHEFKVNGYFGTYVNFPNLTNLTFIDFLYCNSSASGEEIIVPHYIGKRSSNVPTVELKKSDREYILDDFKPKVILIPEYVKTIEAGVFDGLKDVTIKTSFESKPEGWEDGWNGSCDVEWGVDITYLYFWDWARKTEDGLTYYYNDKTSEGVYILDVPNTDELIIPEYIDGKKVVKLGHIDGETEYGVYGPETKELTVQHQFEVCKDISDDRGKYCVSFSHLEKLIFVDFLYCNAVNNQAEITVPWHIGRDSNYNAEKPIVELRKSDREYSLDEFKPKVIKIPDYVEIIEAGVFDGLEDVIIKTSHPFRPDGWEDGWNGSCKVEWGVEINY